MSGSRHFAINTIKKDQPEYINEVEEKTWQKIGYLLEHEDLPIEKRPLGEIRLLEISGSNSSKKNFFKCLSEGALLIKKYINAEVANVYVVEDDNVRKLLYNNGFSSMGSSWPVGPGTVVSAYVAELCKNLILNEKSFYQFLYPLGTGGGVPYPVHLLSSPLLTDDGHCKAVFEFCHTTPKIKFTKAELDVASCMVAWLGHSITPKTVQYASSVDSHQPLFNALGRFQISHTDPEILISDALEVNKFLLDMEKCLLSSQRFDLFCRFSSGLNVQITDNLKFKKCKTLLSMNILKTVVPMEKVNYYEVIKGPVLKCRLRAQMGSNSWRCSEYPLKKGDVIRTVIENHTHLTMTKDDISLNNATFGHHLKGVFSYLCVPIGITSKTRGVVELINKKDADAFSDEDIDEATRCGIHCVAGLLYQKLYLKKQKTFAMCENQKQTLLHNMNPCRHELDILEYKKDNLNLPDFFFKFTYYPSEEDLPNLTLYSWFIFQNVFDSVKRDTAISDKLLNFVLKTKQGYRNLPYHNFEHAFNFCHCIYLITAVNSDIFSNLERKALITAGICHDIDHPGTTNKFIQDTDHSLKSLYHESFLENHHASICKMLIQDCELFSDLSSEDYKFVMRTINTAILSTDLSLHFSMRYKLKNILMNNSFSLKNKTHKTIISSEDLFRETLIAIMMTACDLSGQCKSFRVSERLCRNLYKEFYAEADLATQFGVEPVCVMNKIYSRDVPKYQVQFNSGVSLPCFYILSTVLENTKELYKRCYDVCEEWDQISSSGCDWNVFTEEFIYPT